MNKICTVCRSCKPLSEYHRLKNGKFGRHSHCKTCRKVERQKLNYERPIGRIVQCLQCMEVMPENMFYRNRASSLGVQPYCIRCHKEKIYESQSKLLGFITKIYNKLIRRCIKNHISCRIIKDDIVKLYHHQKGKCALTNEMMTYYSGPILTETKYESKYNIAIDRKDPKKGYEIENVQLTGKMIHQMRLKTDMTNNQFIELCKLVCAETI